MLFRTIFIGLLIGALILGGCRDRELFAPLSEPMPEGEKQVRVPQWDDFCNRHQADPSC